MNPTCVGGVPLGRGGRATLRGGQSLCLVNGRYPLELRFADPPQNPRTPKRPRSPSPTSEEDPPTSEDPLTSQRPPKLKDPPTSEDPPGDPWQQHGPLLVFTPPGVQPSSQVRSGVQFSHFGGGGEALFLLGGSLFVPPPPINSLPPPLSDCCL